MMISSSGIRVASIESESTPRWVNPDESVARLFQLPVVVNLVKVIVERDLLQVARVRAGDMILFGLNETEETEFDTVFLDSVVGSDAI